MSSETTPPYDACMAKPVEETLRPLSDHERQILEVLLKEQFPGKEARALRRQPRSAA